MFRVWLLTVDILIRIGLVKLPEKEQFEELNQHYLKQDSKRLHRNCNEEMVD